MPFPYGRQRDGRPDRIPTGPALRHHGADRPSGQSIGERVQPYYGAEINHGWLYPNLDALIEKGQLDRRTNYYAITEAGEEAIREHRDWSRRT